MPTVITLTDRDLYIDIKQLLATFCTCPIIKANPNNVPMPNGDFVVMNLLFRKDLSMQPVDYYDPEELKAYVQKYTQATLQLDFYGEGSERLSSTFETLWKHPYACEQLKKCQPLNVVSSIRSPIVNEAQKYEQRQIVTANLQFNPVTVIDQSFINDIPLNVTNISKGS